MGKNPNDRKDESQWKTLLKSYTLMQNAHYETDSQNWHIIGTELVSKFHLSHLFENVYASSGHLFEQSQLILPFIFQKYTFTLILTFKPFL